MWPRRGRPARGRERSTTDRPGDPVKAAAAIYTIATAAEPPTRLQLGADAVATVEAKLALVRDELSRWRELSLSTEHNDEV